MASPPTDALYTTQFPPEGITLHSEDANNKVLLAIGRALLSIVSQSEFALLSLSDGFLPE
jgi:hypothetical protein